MLDCNNPKEVVIKVKGCSKYFPGVKAFDHVDFELYKGEIHCIVGENGAGKSTFIRILSGALKPDHGSIEIEGKTVDNLTPSLAQKLGIQTIYQEQYLVDALTIAENIFIGHEIVSKAGFIDYKRLYHEARNLLDSLKINLKANEYVEKLGVAEKHMVQIARALAQEARVLILDEPTASFGNHEIKQLLNLTKSIAQKGVGIIFISHHLEEVFEIADRITVLRDGKKISSYNKNEVDSQKLIRDMVGRNTEMFYTRERVKINSDLFEVINLNRSDVIKNVSFFVNKGEILGVAGMVGSGRTELARLIFGADRKDSGRLVLEGKDITSESPSQAIKNGICLLTEDRQLSGLILCQSIQWNTTVAGQSKFKGLFINLKKEREVTEKYCRDLRIKTPGIEQLIGFLSGGNQQKVVLAKWLYVNAKVIIFDEPTRGIDIGTKEEIYKMMTALAGEGKYIIMISSDMPELLAMSDRIIVMKNGSLSGELSAFEATEEKILTYSLGS